MWEGGEYLLLQRERAARELLLVLEFSQQNAAQNGISSTTFTYLKAGCVMPSYTALAAFSDDGEKEARPTATSLS